MKLGDRTWIYNYPTPPSRRPAVGPVGAFLSGLMSVAIIAFGVWLLVCGTSCRTATVVQAPTDHYYLGRSRVPHPLAGLAVSVHVAPGLPPNGFSYVHKRSLRRALTYWNCVLGTDIFEINRENANVIVSVAPVSFLGYKTLGGPVWRLIARTAYRHNERQELYYAQVSIDTTWVLGRPPQISEQLFRHEFGHVLGLADSAMDGQLMSPTGHSAVAEPLAISDYGASIIRALHGITTPPTWHLPKCQEFAPHE